MIKEKAKKFRLLINLIIFSSSIIFLLSGVVGAIIYLIFLDNGIIYIKNQYTGLWFSFVLIFFSILLKIKIYENEIFIKNYIEILSKVWFFINIIDLLYLIVLFVIMLCLSISYIIGRRIEIAMWSFVISLTIFSNILFIISNNSIQKKFKNSEDNFYEFDVNMEKETTENEKFIKSNKFKFILHIFLYFTTWVFKIIFFLIVLLLLNGSLILSVGSKNIIQI
jgi:hypothetical protein